MPANELMKNNLDPFILEKLNTARKETEIQNVGLHSLKQHKRDSSLFAPGSSI
jgi:hypothetical protein